MFSCCRLFAIACGLMFLVVNLSAQETIQWRFEPGEHQFADMTSVPFEGAQRGSKCGPNETALLIRQFDSTGVTNCECYELPGLKKLSSFVEPKNWNPALSSTGSRYMCSLHDYVLTTIDLTTGKELKPVTVRTQSKPHILFDKAIWFETGELLTLPQLTFVPNHPLTKNVIPFADRDFLLLTVAGKPKHVWHRDAKHLVINGLSYDETLRPGSLYTGCFTFRDFTTRAPDSGFFVGNIQPSSADSGTLMQFRQTDKVQFTASTSTAVVLEKPVEFYAFRGGFFGLTAKYIHIIRSQADRQTVELAGDLKETPLMIPPLVTLDGKHQAICWESSAATSPLIIMPMLKLGYEFKEGQHAVWVQDGGQSLLSNEAEMANLSRRIRTLANKPHDASFDEVIQAYKARNLWWMGPYAASMQTRFTGVPIELPAIVQYSGNSLQRPTSLVIDMPVDVLKKHWWEWPKLDSVKAVPASEMQVLLEELATKEQAQEIALVEEPLPELPALPQLPPTFATLHANDFTWASPLHLPQLFLWPIGVLVFFVCLTLSTRVVGAVTGTAHMIDRSWQVAALASVACISFNMGTNLIVDLFTAGELSNVGLVLLIKGSIKLVCQLAFVGWIFRIALGGTAGDKIAIFILTYLGSTVLMILFAVLVVMGGNLPR